MKPSCVVVFVLGFVAATLGAPNLVYWVSRHSAVVDSFPVDGNVNQQTNFITSFGNSLDFRKEYLKTTRTGTAVHIAPGRVIYVFGCVSVKLVHMVTLWAQESGLVILVHVCPTAQPDRLFCAAN
jgi:hypothetical protein